MNTRQIHIFLDIGQNMTTESLCFNQFLPEITCCYNNIILKIKTVRIQKSTNNWSSCFHTFQENSLFFSENTEGWNLMVATYITCKSIHWNN